MVVASKIISETKFTVSKLFCNAKLSFLAITYIVTSRVFCQLLEVRVQQQNAAKTKLQSQMEDLPSRAPILAHAGEK